MVPRGSRDPRKEDPTSYQLDKDFQDLYARYKDEDPAPKAQHAIPNTSVRWAAQHFRTGTAREQTTAWLVVLAFFFLLRVGEYTPTRNKKRRKRTIPLRKCDVMLLRDGTPLSREAPLHEMLTANGATICLENQKNGHKDETIYHDGTNDELMNPVRAMAYLLDGLRGMPLGTPLGTVTDGARRARVSDTDVRDMLRQAARADGLEAAGYDLARIGTHSLRAGGAVRLALAGYNEPTIMKIGRWSSATYLRYIQPNISPLTRGCAQAMAEPLRFYNVQVR